MHIVRRRGWELSERLVTPEALVLGRRTALAGAGAVVLAAAAPERNPKYVAGRGGLVSYGADTDDLERGTAHPPRVVNCVRAYMASPPIRRP